MTKNRTIIWYFITATALTQLSCSEKSSSPLYPIIERGKYGFIDSSGNSVIPCKFSYVGSFSNGLAVAGIDSNYGYINQEGQFVIEPKISLVNLPIGLYPLKKIKSLRDVLRGSIGELEFADGLALFFDRTANKFGYINSKGVIEIEPKFANGTKFRNGYAVVATSFDPINWSKSKLGVINTKGEFVIPDKYQKITRLSENFATGTIISKIDSLNHAFASFVLNGKGHVINAILPGQIIDADEFDGGFCRGLNGFMHTLTGAGYFIFDSTGKAIENKKTKEPFYFEDLIINNGRFVWYKMNGKYSWAILEKSGEVFVRDDRLYDTIRGGFDKSGLACVKISEQGGDKGLYGYIDTLGNFIIEPKFRNAQNFRNGLAYASLQSGNILVVGYINKKANFIWSQETRTPISEY